MFQTRARLDQLYTPLDHLQKAFGESFQVLAGRAAQWTLNDQESETVDSRPGQVLCATSAFGWESARGYHPVERGSQKLEGIEAALACSTGRLSLKSVSASCRSITHRACCSKMS